MFALPLTQMWSINFSALTNSYEVSEEQRDDGVERERG